VSAGSLGIRRHNHRDALAGRGIPPGKDGSHGQKLHRNSFVLA
jgi:hypothetical protein